MRDFNKKLVEKSFLLLAKDSLAPVEKTDLINYNICNKYGNESITQVCRLLSSSGQNGFHVFFREEALTRCPPICNVNTSVQFLAY